MSGLYSSSPELQYSRINAADCLNVEPHYWQYQYRVQLLFFVFYNVFNEIFSIVR